MLYLDHHGAFVARSRLTPKRAKQLVEAGLGVVMLQVDFQGSQLSQRDADDLRVEAWIAEATGLEVWWWAWCQPAAPPRKGRRPTGPDALHERLEALVAELGAPPVFVANCEVGGGWSSGAPQLRPVADAARAAGICRVALASHGMIGRRWPLDGYDIGMPMLYNKAHVTPEWARRCIDTWGRLPSLWPILGCADAASTAEQMLADQRALRALDIPGWSWWTARQLTGARLRAAASARTT